MRQLPEDLYPFVTRGQEQPNLEYKGDVSWHDREMKLKIVQTIFALSNQEQGGVIVVGVDNQGKVIGLSEQNCSSFSHDDLNRHLLNKGNQPIKCDLEPFLYSTDGEGKKIVIIQVSETDEY